MNDFYLQWNFHYTFRSSLNLSLVAYVEFQMAQGLLQL